MAYCTYEDVIKMSGTSRKRLGFPELVSTTTTESSENLEVTSETTNDEPKDEFKELIEEWISQSESFINSYCKRNWNDYIEDGKEVHVTVPKVVKNVCIRLTSNIIAFHYKRRDNPIKKVNDYTIKVYESDVFTDDLKSDLKPFVKSSRVSIFKI